MWFITLDKVWCGKAQLPASYLFLLTNCLKKTQELSLLRLGCLIALISELLGYFFITWGLAAPTVSFIFILGMLLKVGGGLVSSLLQNMSGSLWSLELHETLKEIKPFNHEINSSLVDHGCSELEVQALHSLPLDVYQSELNCFRRSFLLNLGTPIACGLALLITGDFLSSFMVIFLGLLSFPIGEAFFKKFTFRGESKFRIGRSAGITNFLQQVYKEHFFQTFQVNLLSQLPLLLFSMRFILNGGGLLLSTFFAYTQGLVGLTGTLAFQRARVTSLRTSEIAKHLIEVLSGDDYLLSPSRWKAHCGVKSPSSPNFVNTDIQNGIFCSNFQSNLSSRYSAKQLPPLNCIIPSGGVSVLQAASGLGKSTLLLSLKHMLDHKGELFFIKDGHWQNVHFLKKEALQNAIFLHREDNIDKSARLLDLFKDVLKSELSVKYQIMLKEFGQYAALAWQAADNLIEDEIRHLQKGKPSAFPMSMMNALQEMRKERHEVLKSILKCAGGNLELPQIFPERVFSSLSSGEKRRMMCLLALESARHHSGLKLVILDEPFTHLDAENLQQQLHVIQQIQRLNDAPAQLIISHSFIEEIRAGLEGVQVLDTTRV